MHKLGLILLMIAAPGWAAVNPCTYIRGIPGLNFYESLHPSGLWIVMNCAKGTAYSAQTCSCSDFIFGCKLYATSSVDKFAFFVNNIVNYKACSFGTVFHPELCGCFEPKTSTIVQ
ncbi:uncharacterized protein LOC133184491 [Saccostrea echinata]|uniref:uncharacterized protein LOC133184491 n=1 Tax=Saccostrea echinata TaxID=191078 RepID=UPI002A839CA6|nr:uncharacterized protein LOC133184491 [Saccostrea echinata]